jgi:hypothetical protein
MPKHRSLLHAIAFSVAAMAFSESALAEDKDSFAVVELGGAGDWGVPSGAASFGPTAGVEFTPIKNWLVIETSVTPQFNRGQTEWNTDFVFEKPFDLSPTVEFEPGIGPAWIHAKNDSIAAEVVADFMFWPTPDRKYGWFLEPSYSYSFASGHQQSFGVSGGLLISIR